MPGGREGGAWAGGAGGCLASCPALTPLGRFWLNPPLPTRPHTPTHNTHNPAPHPHYPRAHALTAIPTVQPEPGGGPARLLGGVGHDGGGRHTVRARYCAALAVAALRCAFFGPLQGHQEPQLNRFTTPARSCCMSSARPLKPEGRCEAPCAGTPNPTLTNANGQGGLLLFCLPHKHTRAHTTTRAAPPPPPCSAPPGRGAASSAPAASWPTPTCSA